MKKRIIVNESARDNFLYAKVNLKMNFEQRIDGFCIHI